MSFVGGFIKTSGILSGMQHASRETIGDALTLKGLRGSLGQLNSGYKGRLKDLIKTKSGREDLGTAIGKSVPSALAGALHFAMANKVRQIIKKKQRVHEEPYYL